jgi:hypothetical protein
MAQSAESATLTDVLDGEEEAASSRLRDMTATELDELDRACGDIRRLIVEEKARRFAAATPTLTTGERINRLFGN